MVTAVIMIFVISAFKEVFQFVWSPTSRPQLCWYGNIRVFRQLLVYYFRNHRPQASISSFRHGAQREDAKGDGPIAAEISRIWRSLVTNPRLARWTRTLSTMFAAGVPLVEALDSVGGASGNAVFAEATEQIQREVSHGNCIDGLNARYRLVSCHGDANVFDW